MTTASAGLYRQLILRVPDKLKGRVRERVQAGQSDNMDFVQDGENPLKYVFTIDGERYPARLVNLPCNLETLKTTDNTMYYKSADIGQMLIVYEDEDAFNADAEDASIGPAQYYADGITPPTRNIVRRKFVKARPVLGKFPKAQVMTVESQLEMLINATAAEPVTEVHEEIVDFEPWMLDPSAAITGRVAGVTLQITGSSNVTEMRAAGEGGALFGHEVLAYHPEALLARGELPIEEPPKQAAPAAPAVVAVSVGPKAPVAAQPQAAAAAPAAQAPTAMDISTHSLPSAVDDELDGLLNAEEDHFEDLFNMDPKDSLLGGGFM
ncbi:TAFII55 protein conserved region-domain-containing protein [Tribonema minus]|uniref:TAFII55 protein conserved region-domain-containing protein n=1 Tax=Tribonema minus TaxID=303371 RepID=A0A835YLK6_9STRA|nr:TAFII55 protein conserved region-domain-containing protein [Tribonema minus]